MYFDSPMFHSSDTQYMHEYLSVPKAHYQCNLLAVALQSVLLTLPEYSQALMMEQMSVAALGRMALLSALPLVLHSAL